ncbi:hypothetical protein RJ639_014725 [Escallonia herrerae]|uniref:Reverse transcriptase/retrotransposon-derived protein RNase H-like domain-containing protein n=1 Tax=Escallonia herrerae TaxID=1293975 RepID=A0AA88VL86_9ASTE|nr:hypothetical protein RJ639_014725 [Escallonia herrerae]
MPTTTTIVRTTTVAVPTIPAVISAAVTTASAPVTVVPPAVTITHPAVNTVLPPLQTINVSTPTTTGTIHTTPPVMNSQADLMAILRAMQQSIERLQAAVDNPPPQSEPFQPPNERYRDSYYNPGEHRAERYTSSPVIIGRPFTEEVDHFPTPANFKMPPCESYDGTGDPMEHLACFISGMNLHLGPAKRPKASTTISFDDTDLEEVITPHDDALVISLQIDAYVIKCILVDTGSSADILFEEAFSQMKISRDRIRSVSSPCGFTGVRTSGKSNSPHRSYWDIPASSYTINQLPALKNIKDFEWTAECQASFEALKNYLATPPLLSKPLVGEELFLYLAIAESALSAVLVREQDDEEQLPQQERPFTWTLHVDGSSNVNGSRAETFVYFHITQVSRTDNASVDALSCLASLDPSGLSQTVHLELLHEPSINCHEVMQTEHEPSWMDPIKSYQPIVHKLEESFHALPDTRL